MVFHASSLPGLSSGSAPAKSPPLLPALFRGVPGKLRKHPFRHPLTPRPLFPTVCPLQQAADRPSASLNTRAIPQNPKKGPKMAKVTLKNVFKIYPGDKGKDVTAV